jgi:hypothetical protein
MDVSKVSVVDPRIVQNKPVYAVEKGALSITNQTFQAIANSASQQTFQVQVPSENIFVDRAVDWVNTATVKVTVTRAATLNAILVTPGVDFSLAPFPVTQSVSTMTATINDQTVTINAADVLPQVLRLADMAQTRQQRTCPTMLDKYFNVQSAASFPNSPVGSFGSQYDSSNAPNGAWADVSFSVAGLSQTGGGVVGINAAGLPFVQTAGTSGVYSFLVTFSTAEKLVLPPFIFADDHELSTGLFGIQNMQFTMNFNEPTRSLRIANSASPLAKPVVAWYSGANGSPFSSAVVQTQFLTPSLDVPLPAKSIVRWSEFPRYISPLSAASLVEGTAGKVATISSQTITLPSIPDLLIIYVKPQTYPDCTLGDFSLPVTKISLQFDNFSGLLSNHSAYELYKMSVNNGLEMTWDEWSGSAWANGAKTALVGGPLVLRPGRDFALSTGQSSGLVGNFTLQFDLTVDNTVAKWGVSDGDYAGRGVSIYTVTANSGFFETIRGSSRILKGVVTEQDILSAPMAEVKESSERMVGQGKAKTAYKSGGALGRMSNYRKH